MRIILRIFFCLFVFTSCIKDGSKTPYEVVDFVDVGGLVPTFEVSDGDGNTFSSSDFIGKRSLLVLFETVCPDCGRVLPDIDKYVWSALKDDSDYLLVTISRGEAAEVVNKYWADNKFTMPQYLDPGRQVFSKFASSTIPRLYIINKEGIIEWKAIEELNISIDELISLIKGQSTD